MKEGTGKSDGTVNKRIIFGGLMLIYLLLLAVLALYYLNLRQKTFVTKGSIQDMGNPGVVLEGERSKEWREGNKYPYTTGMEYDFRIVNHDRRKVYDWRAEIQFAVNFDIDSSWNGEFSKVDHTLVVIPDEESSVVEKGREKTFGLVMITDDNELAGDYRLSYKLDVHLTESPLFWLLLAGMGLTLTVFIADKINEAKYNKLKNKQEEIRGILQESFETFARIIDAKDPYTRGHSLRVAEYAKLIAGEMGYSEEDRERVYWIGMLHDIGKIGVTDLILQKPGRLDNSEYSLIQTHVDVGGRILEDFEALPGIAEGAKYHHERWDGKGYPEGLHGEVIPLSARIMAVADVFDALTSKRIYKPAFPVEEALKILQDGAGKQFDPKCVEVFMEALPEVKKVLRKYNQDA